MPIQHMWTIEREVGFDCEHFASGVLDNAMDCLESDGFLQPAVFFITDGEIICFAISFEGYEQKMATYDEVIQSAKRLSATAIITLNDAYIGDKYDPDKYVWGEAAKNPKGEMILVTLSGPNRENWSKEVEYVRDNGTIVFKEPHTEKKSFIGMLGEWAKSGQRVN